ncbi:MAG TPA: hypothetical protein VKU44_08115 [Terriglobia bacterium]|nr:hypothetical protein [Terriglobia bacterium]
MRSPNLTSFNVAGLVERLRRHDDQARSDFERAVELDPAFWLARLEL